MIYPLTPGTTAIFVIDAQREYFDEFRPLYMAHARAILPNLSRLLDAARSTGAIPVIVQHSHEPSGSDVGRMADFDPTPLFVEGTEGVDLVPEMRPTDKDVVIKKTRYSAFVETDLDSQLRSRGVDTVVISGLMTNYCCVATARHAHDLDYRVLFVADANAGPDMPDLGFGVITHGDMLRAVATTLAGGIAEVVDTADVLQRLKSSS